MNSWNCLTYHLKSVVELVYLEVNTSTVVCVENCKNLVDEKFCFPFRQHSCVPDQQFQKRQTDAAELWIRMKEFLHFQHLAHSQCSRWIVLNEAAKEMHVLTWIINMFCWTRPNWPSTMKKALNITKCRTWSLFKSLPEPLLHLLLAFLCFRAQEGHILFRQGVATFKIFGMMIASFWKGTKAILFALFSLCWKYNYSHIQQTIILIFLKTFCDAETYFSNHCLKDCMMLKQTILCSSSEFPPSSSFLVSRHDFK